MKKLVLPVIAALAISACATPRAFNRVDTAARANLNKMDTVLIVGQSEIDAEINQSNMSGATGGGLIPALIDAGVNSKRTKKAEELIGPLRDKLIDYDFAAKLENSIATEFVALGVDGATNVELKRALEKTYMQDKVSGTDADAVMFVISTYKLTPDFDAIVATANVTVYPKSPALNAYKEKPDEDAKMTEYHDNIYRNNFRSVIPLEVAGDLEANSVAVAAMNTEEWVSVLDQSAARLATQITTDFTMDDVNDEK